VAQFDRRLSLYSAVGGDFVLGWASEPGLVDVDVRHRALQATTKPGAVTRSVMSAFERWSSVSTQAARDRHAGSLASLGVSPPPLGLSVEASRLVYVPLWTAILVRGGAEGVSRAIDRRIRSGSSSLSCPTGHQR
jgi:hypothetical protein